jgi:hypothetical protein
MYLNHAHKERLSGLESAAGLYSYAFTKAENAKQAHAEPKEQRTMKYWHERLYDAQNPAPKVTFNQYIKDVSRDGRAGWARLHFKRLQAKHEKTHEEAHEETHEDANALKDVCIPYTGFLELSLCLQKNDKECNPLLIKLGGKGNVNALEHAIVTLVEKWVAHDGCMRAQPAGP